MEKNKASPRVWREGKRVGGCCDTEYGDWIWDLERFI